MFYSKGQFCGYLFCGCYFRGYESCANGCVDSAVRGYNKFYKEIWKASYGEKKEIFDPFAVSVMKNSTYFYSAIITW